MKPVTQTRGYENDSFRGNCFPACIASIFELPLPAVPRYDTQHVYNWLRRRYPGIGMKRIVYFKPHPKYPFEYVDIAKAKPPDHPGYWIATVESPRFTTLCHRCFGKKRIKVYLKDDGHLPEKERVSRRERCFACKGKGREIGLHAVVMQGNKLAWDPSPKRDMGIGRFRGETLFYVNDPSLLHRVRTPSARGSST